MGMLLPGRLTKSAAAVGSHGSIRDQSHVWSWLAGERRKKFKVWVWLFIYIDIDFRL
jgi:hypothetical protein